MDRYVDRHPGRSPFIATEADGRLRYEMVVRLVDGSRAQLVVWCGDDVTLAIYRSAMTLSTWQRGADATSS